jgi:hypothetical protein
MGDANYTLSNLNGTSDEARNQVLVVPSSTTLSATRYVYAPFVQKTYVISNQSSGGQSIYIQGIVSGTPTGSPLLIPNGVTVQVYCDGVNGFYSGSTGSAGNFVVNGTLTASGIADVGTLTAAGAFAAYNGAQFTGSISGTTLTVTAVATGTLAVNQYLTGSGITSGTYITSFSTGSGGTGTYNVNNSQTVSSETMYAGATVTAITPLPTDNSTKVATTAFVQSKVGTLGTMATQNASSVAITGGSITGTTVSGSGVTAASAAAIANTGGWNITPTGTKLYFNYNGTNVGSLDSSGNLIVTGNVTASGTP